MSEKNMFDEAVRVISQDGDYDGTANYRKKWEGMEFDSTSGAGINGATVRRISDSYVLYDAHDYGRCVNELHDGPWVIRMVREADIIKAKDLAEKEYKLKLEEAARVRKFSAVDF